MNWPALVGAVLLRAENFQADCSGFVLGLLLHTSTHNHCVMINELLKSKCLNRAQRVQRSEAIMVVITCRRLQEGFFAMHCGIGENNSGFTFVQRL